jgi:hypothetical protein
VYRLSSHSHSLILFLLSVIALYILVETLFTVLFHENKTEKKVNKKNEIEYAAFEPDADHSYSFNEHNIIFENFGYCYDFYFRNVSFGRFYVQPTTKNPSATSHLIPLYRYTLLSSRKR